MPVLTLRSSRFEFWRFLSVSWLKWATSPCHAEPKWASGPVRLEFWLQQHNNTIVHVSCLGLLLSVGDFGVLFIKTWHSNGFRAEFSFDRSAQWTFLHVLKPFSQIWKKHTLLLDELPRYISYKYHIYSHQIEDFKAHWQQQLESFGMWNVGHLPPQWWTRYGLFIPHWSQAKIQQRWNSGWQRVPQFESES